MYRRARATGTTTKKKKAEQRALRRCSSPHVGAHTQINGYETETVKFELGDMPPTSAEWGRGPRGATVITNLQRVFLVPGTWTN
jgi:hypothetical protein